MEHPTADWGKGVVLEDAEGSTVLVSFESVGIKTVSLKHVDLRVLSEPIATNDDVERLILVSRLYIDEPFLDIYHDLKSKFPEHLVIIQNGYFFEALEDDAEYLRGLYGWNIHARGNASITGFPDKAVSVWNRLRDLNQPFLVLKQLPTERHGRIQRQIAEIFDGEVGMSAARERLASNASFTERVNDGPMCDEPAQDSVANGCQILGLELDKARIRELLQELQAPVEKPPGFGWEFGGDSWMRMVGNEFDRNRRKNAKFELSALLREYLRSLRKNSRDTGASKVLTQTKNAISESEQFLIAAALILSSGPDLDVVNEFKSAIEAYQSR